MKHLFQTNQEYRQLREYFLKLETLAEKMGLEVDELFEIPESEKPAVHAPSEKKINSISERRNWIFNNENKKESNDKKQISDSSFLRNAK